MQGKDMKNTAPITSPAKIVEKQRYSKPVLVELGSVAQMTQANLGGGIDGILSPTTAS
jgi:hypothetical protein